VLASEDPTGTYASLPVCGCYFPLPHSILDSWHKPAKEANYIFDVYYSGAQAYFL
jgi:hypothetical protein